MQEIAESDAAPSITRISDGAETGFSLATSKESKGMQKFLSGTVLPGLMKAKGWKNLETDICLSFIGYEGSESHQKRQKSLVDAIVKKHNGMGVGTGPGVLYDQKKFDTPYLRDFLLDRGAAGDVSETAMPWSKVNQVHDAAIAAAHKAYDELGTHGWIMSHMSHSYHSGACLYFTFAFVFGDNPLAEYDYVKGAIQQAFVDNDSSVSHHHGVGLEHAPWLEQDISTEGVHVLKAVFDATDPGSNLNPGKILADPVQAATGPGSRVLPGTTAKKAAAPAKKAAPRKTAKVSAS
jgi:alkyldihydroxyacetonephosphate synthase